MGAIADAKRTVRKRIAKRLNSKTAKLRKGKSSKTAKKMAVPQPPSEAQINKIEHMLIEKVNENPNLSKQEANTIIAKIKANKGKIALGLLALTAGAFGGHHIYKDPHAFMENLTSAASALKSGATSALTGIQGFFTKPKIGGKRRRTHRRQRR